MSEFYFCIFCDTIVLSLDLLRHHLLQHFAEEANEDHLCLSDSERKFVDNLVKYERQLSASMALMPKELPKSYVKTLMIGCPACDAVIRCYDLIPNRDNKTVCHCGKRSADMPVFKCVQCHRFNHLKCVCKSDNGKCLDCQSKNFEISYLKCLPFEAQRDHCYQHLDYYPFVCQFVSGSGGRMCGQKLITYNSCEKHLIYGHKQRLDESQNKFDVLSSHFDYNPIPKIDDLINTRLNSKTNFNDIPSITIPENSCHQSISMSNSGLNGVRLEFIDDSDEEFNRSFHYTTEDIVKSYPKSQTAIYCPAKQPEPMSDHNYLRSEPLDDFYEYNLDYIPIPNSLPKKRGRPKGSKNRFSIQSIVEPEVDTISEPEEVVNHLFDPKDWFTQTKATKFPYFPQKDDEVYYLPYGHELYKQEVMRRRLYNQSNRNYTMRFFNYDIIVAKVAKIDFLFKERRKTETVIRCIYITLRPYDDKYGTIIHVKYHDMEGVLDFIVLKEHYDFSLQKFWQIGENFRSIVDDKYWFGVVIGYNESNYCQMSQFKKYQIKWHSNGAVDFLSPWDLETISPSVPFERISFVPITDSDRRFFFSRRREEWPDFNEEKELERLVKGLKIIYNMDKTVEFPILQDLTDSRYREKILYPVDMKTFIARIENHFYRRHLAIKYDIKFMEANIRKLVKSVKRDPEYRLDDVFAKRLKYHTKFVTALCLLFIDTHECKNPYDLYPNIDDYLETHDVKCYSAKRVHLNMRKKYPNSLPASHKRLPKRPQSFGDSAKTLKIFKALSNTETLNRQSGHLQTPQATTSSSSKSKEPITKAITQSVPHIKQMVVPFNESDQDIIDSESDEEEIPKNEYQIKAFDNCSDDSDVDPDYSTSVYYKKHLY